MVAKLCPPPPCFSVLQGADGRRLYLKNRSPVASTMPIMPVLYQDGGFQFQIAAIDPDMGDPDLADQVRFFLGNRNEMGGVLGNPVYVPLPDNSTQQVFTWYEVRHPQPCAVCAGAAAPAAHASSQQLADVLATPAGQLPLLYLPAAPGDFVHAHVQPAR